MRLKKNDTLEAKATTVTESTSTNARACRASRATTAVTAVATATSRARSTAAASVGASAACGRRRRSCYMRRFDPHPSVSMPTRPRVAGDVAVLQVHAPRRCTRRHRRRGGDARHEIRHEAHGRGDHLQLHTHRRDGLLQPRDGRMRIEGGAHPGTHGVPHYAPHAIKACLPRCR